MGRRCGCRSRSFHRYYGDTLAIYDTHDLQQQFLSLSVVADWRRVVATAGPAPILHLGILAEQCGRPTDQGLPARGRMNTSRIEKFVIGSWLTVAIVAIGLATSGCSPDDDQTAGCSKLANEIEVERQLLQHCDSDGDCGASEGKGSCGCTRGLAIRADADPTKYRALIDRAASCELPLGSTCDCPAADGFRCESGRCAWNYITP